jgi:hypothetical protein
MRNIFNKQFFDGIIENWRKDLRENPLVFWIEMAGTLSCMIASGSLAITAPNPNLLEVYFFYLCGSSLLMVSSYMRSNGFWVFLNLFFWCIDIVGLWNTWHG